MDVKIYNINHHKTSEGYTYLLLTISNICYLPINIVKGKSSFNKINHPLLDKNNYRYLNYI